MCGCVFEYTTFHGDICDIFVCVLICFIYMCVCVCMYVYTTFNDNTCEIYVCVY